MSTNGNIQRLLNDAELRVAWLRFRETIDNDRGLKERSVDNRRERDRNGDRPVWFSVPMGESRV